MHDELSHSLQSLHPIERIHQVLAESGRAMIAKQQALVIGEERLDYIGDFIRARHAKRDRSDAPQENHRFWKDVIRNLFSSKGKARSNGRMRVNYGNTVRAFA